MEKPNSSSDKNGPDSQMNVNEFLVKYLEAQMIMADPQV
jgi:hypothetical protein